MNEFLYPGKVQPNLNVQANGDRETEYFFKRFIINGGCDSLFCPADGANRQHKSVAADSMLLM